MINYLKSLLKYIAFVIILIAIFIGIQLLLPQGKIELTHNQAIVFSIIGVIVMAIGIKLTNDL